jgi:hypothetical protein
LVVTRGGYSFNLSSGKANRDYRVCCDSANVAVFGKLAINSNDPKHPEHQSSTHGRAAGKPAVAARRAFRQPNVTTSGAANASTLTKRDWKHCRLYRLCDNRTISR